MVVYRKDSHDNDSHDEGRYSFCMMYLEHSQKEKVNASHYTISECCGLKEPADRGTAHSHWEASNFPDPGRKVFEPLPKGQPSIINRK